MTSREILEKYLDFYMKRGHALIPNVSLVPQNDPTLLFVNSGMFPLVNYLSGLPHPSGKRLVNVQRSLRLADLEEVGDKSHTLAFHMIGNWSLGDYFKKEQLPWAYEFLVEILGIDPKRLVATVFAGDENAPTDTASIEILKEIFAKYGVDAKENEIIWLYSKKQGNWWQRGDTVGELGGPCSEVFYYFGEGSPSGKSPEEYEDDFLEIGNSVFMEYKRTESGWEKLPQSNVDFGGGLERITWVVQNKSDIFETDNFWPIIQKVEELSNKQYKSDATTTKNMRILADHIRSCVFLAMDGVMPSNKDQGYVLRKLIRRMVRCGRSLGVEKNISVSLVPIAVEMFSWLYPDLKEKSSDIQTIFSQEEEKFRKTLIAGSKEFHRLALDQYVQGGNISAIANSAFMLYQSLGYPLEMFLADLGDKYTLNTEIIDLISGEFEQKVKSHQDESRSGAEMKFKGGLADHSEQTTKYHTATHLLHMALRKVLGDRIVQHGSNITGERLRFDFNYDKKLTPDQVSQIEMLINDTISEHLPVNFVILPKEEAEKTGAIHAFGEKYGDQVKVYFVGDSLENAVSKEFCGGPHVSNTSEIGRITLFKQEKIGQNLLRVYAK